MGQPALVIDLDAPCHGEAEGLYEAVPRETCYGHSPRLNVSLDGKRDDAGLQHGGKNLVLIHVPGFSFAVFGTDALFSDALYGGLWM